MRKGELTGRRALVMGLGLHGGGVATTKWLLARGARVTATDMRSRDILRPSLLALRGLPVRYVLRKHEKKDFASHDMVVVNPGVPRESEYLAVARSAGKEIVNDVSLFFAHNKNPAIAVTGTRGKTTTTLFIAELLRKKYRNVRPSGNTPENALLKEIDRRKGAHTPVVAELSSWQLEFLSETLPAPHIAVITNLYHDHLNRYGGRMEEYADAKAHIFAGQKEGDVLILSRDNTWTPYFLKKKPRARILFVSTSRLPKQESGIFLRNSTIMFRENGVEEKLFSAKRFIAERGMHNVENLLNAVLAVKLFDPSIVVTERDALGLPTPHMRQEIVLRKGRVTVVNDSCATSPDGTIAAVLRFCNLGNVVLITGGTDKALRFTELAKVIKKHIPRGHLIFLEGSATTKLLHALHHQKMSSPGLDMNVRKNLDSCVMEALQIAKNLQKESHKKVTILFSPGAASFEKFLHEFDRGERFNVLIKKHFPKY